MKKMLFPTLVLLSLSAACTTGQTPPPQEKTLVTRSRCGSTAGRHP
jgi:hypothetical protein